MFTHSVNDHADDLLRKKDPAHNPCDRSICAGLLLYFFTMEGLFLITIPEIEKHRTI